MENVSGSGKEIRAEDEIRIVKLPSVRITYKHTFFIFCGNQIY
jgi:hypothetical protein